MTGCENESWTLQSLSDALRDEHKDKKKIVVPMFQRGKRWSRHQEEAFIDSLIKGYPVGTMLFYRTFENNQETYILVDGLQRGNSIRKYMTNPTEFFYDANISDEVCSKICGILNLDDNKHYSEIRSILTSFIRTQKTFKNLQYYSPARDIAEHFDAGWEVIGELIDTIAGFFKERQELYDKIASTVIPVIVYTGDEDNLLEIFERINSKGTVLTKYEVYAASWPIKQTYVVENSAIIEYVIKKYDALISAGFEMHHYSSAEMRANRRINIFEYLFGLSKYLVNEYEILGFEKSLADDEVNTLAFELTNACLNDSDKIKDLYKNFENLDVNVFEKALARAIEFVNESVTVITKFKGNKRTSTKPFHAKYQILSMISTTFKEMFQGTDLVTLNDSWDERKDLISHNLVQYYVYDIITEFWSEGGTKKIYAAAKPNRYAIELSGRAWMVALDGFFEKSMLRAESKKIANPKSEEYVILNCIYLDIFTAQDQLSTEKYDVEHIATKEQMRRLIDSCNGTGLPVSCIANLCYLPQYVNRSKKDRNFYQDKKYLEHIDLLEVESKYSFTEEQDLEWMDMPYEKPEDFLVLKEYYTDFCTKRFDKMKRLFCDSLGIKYGEYTEEPDHLKETVVVPEPVPSSNKRKSFAANCVQQLAERTQTELVKIGRSTYATKDGKTGYSITTSKAYIQGKREKFWFAYRKKNISEIAKYENQYVIYGCKDESTLVRLPVPLIEGYLDRLNTSKEDDGEIAHWHIVFFKDVDGRMTWMFSHPSIEEIDITKYML